jgi:hypothetical protein
MRNTPLFRERPLVLRIVTGGIVPVAFGAVTGLVLGVSAAGYWALSLLALAGGVLAGFEHHGGWEGADRGLIGGALFGTALVVAHALAGTHAQVSVPKFAPILVVFTAIIGMFAGALGGRLRRTGTGQPSGSASARS